MFKIGDKVKVIHNNNGSGIVKKAMNKIGMITIIYSEIINVEFDEKIYGITSIGFYKNEIEKVNTEGQLLFSFMDEQ